jgi:predicted TIM-barrel fold metal-dependent hydrolase
MKGGFAAIDADRHTMEPDTLWDTYLEPRFRGRVVARGDVQLIDGRPFSSSHAAQPDSGFRSWSQTDDYKRVWGDALAQGFSPAANLKDMDREGVDVAVHFPTYGLHMIWVEDIDPELSLAICRAYNQWVADYCSYDPARLKAVAQLPVYEPRLAVAEMHRAREQGLVGVMWRPNPFRGRSLAHPDYFPVYEAASELDLPILVHEGAGTMLHQAGDERYLDQSMARHIACHPFEQMLACLNLITTGVLERFPRLKVGFMESGCGWLSFWLERMDEHWDHTFADMKKVTAEPPSFYFKRQCFISSDPGEPYVRDVVRDVGDDYLLTATDYPHPDALEKFPDHTIGAVVDDPVLSETAKRKILWDNPARLYGLTAAPPVNGAGR